MTRIWTFPTVPVSKQLFHVPGAAVEGGFTSGAVRIMSPEPGGRSVLELEPAMRDEWNSPVLSWLMSKGNGEVFRVRLAPTPQVYRSSAGQSDVPWQPETLWAGDRPWAGDAVTTFVADALEGVGTVRVAGTVLQPGHTISDGKTTYAVDEATYQSDGTTIVAVKPPVRRPIKAGDTAYYRGYFTGTISNIGEIRATYDRSMNGLIQLGKIMLTEAIVDD